MGKEENISIKLRKYTEDDSAENAIELVGTYTF